MIFYNQDPSTKLSLVRKQLNLVIVSLNIPTELNSIVFSDSFTLAFDNFSIEYSLRSTNLFTQYLILAIYDKDYNLLNNALIN